MSQSSSFLLAAKKEKKIKSFARARVNLTLILGSIQIFFTSLNFTSVVRNAHPIEQCTCILPYLQVTPKIWTRHLATLAMKILSAYSGNHGNAKAWQTKSKFLKLCQFLTGRKTIVIHTISLNNFFMKLTHDQSL